MGGIKNRDAKMKANKVFASGGGGGGTKGPAIVDKRGQEVKCPYCDKIYKESGRLKEHIASKHADQLQPQDAAPSASAAAAAGPSGGGSKGGGKGGAGGAAAAAGAGGKEAPAQSSAAAAAAAVARAALASAAAANSKAPIAGAPVGAAASGSSGGVMQVGSKAGYYTSKSPQLHLQEWVQREKRPRMRVQPRKLDNGKWTCKVVLPDGKKDENDVVVFLDEAHAAEDEEEARQRACVAALHRVAGDRQLDLILPKQYGPMWRELGEARRAREEAAAARRARDEERKKAEEARRRRQNMRTPQVVVMSSAKQQLVQSLLRDRDRALGLDGGAGAGSGASGSGADEGALSHVVDELSAMGFSPQHVQLAYERTSVRTAGGVSVESLLDWLLINLPAEQLPGQFTKGSSTNAVSLVARADPSAPSLQAVARLMAHGYTSAECEAALRAAKNDERAALLQLYRNLTGVRLQPLAAPAVVPDDADGDPWAEELMVLESIYDSQFAVQSEDAVRLTLGLPEGCQLATRADAPLVLEFVRMAGAEEGAGAGPAYPLVPPLVCVSCSGLAAGALRHLTRVIAREAASLLGQPMLHDLAARALEEAASMDPAACEASAAEAEGAGGLEGQQEEAQEEGLGRQDSSLVEGFEGLTVEDEEEEAGPEEEDNGDKVRAAAAARRRRPEGPPPPRRRSPAELAAESARLQRLQSDIASSPALADIRRTRAALPAAAKRSELLALLRQHDVVVVSGATGCGKSTQVPQYILEEAVEGGHGATCNIVVTQPRRISALGLASRVAAERGGRPGEVVGYSVRLEHRTSAATRLTFVTTGILLRRLLADPELQGTTHIVLDEVHERSIEIDLLLLLLRDLLSRRRAQAADQAAHQQQQQRQQPPQLKIVLMSATADADLFCRYMGQGLAGAVPPQQPGAGSGPKGGRRGGAGADSNGGSVGSITIPGFTYPVREFYLEDAFELTGHVIGRDNKYARRGGPRRGGKQGGDGDVEGAGEGGGGGGGGPVLSGSLPSYSEATLRSLSVVDEDQINYDLLVDVVAEVIRRHRRDGAAAFMTDWPQAYTSGKGDMSGGGAILVFLPGAPEISRLQRLLLASGKVLEAAGGRGSLRVLPLHGSLSSAEQSKVFARPPAGTFKVVLSTNVAETSITIDDVTVVIDSGRVKEMSHDPERSIMRLQEGWVSKAAAQQRRGRAGRVRPGICFRLFSSEQWGRMPHHTEPEMLRSPLESVCLLVRGMMTSAAAPPAASAPAFAAAAASPPATVGAFLARCLSPPSSKAVSSAVSLLRCIGAFDADERLTSLGRHLNRMPMDPRVGKALVYGSLLGCLDPVLTVTAAMAHGRPVFLNLQNAADGVSEARRQLLKGAVASRSDHLALVAAYNAWCRAVDKGGRSAGSSLCADCGLSESSLEAVQAGRAEYARVLADLGFLPYHVAADPRVAAHPAAPLPGSDWLAAPANRNAANARFLKAALCAGFYPSLLRVDQPTRYVEVHGGTAEAENDPKDIKLYDRERGRTFVHPASVCFTVGKYESGWVVYTQMTETSKLFVRELSMVPVYALLLFGGDISVDRDRGLLRLDGWAEFRASPQVGVMVRELRGEMDRLLGAKIAAPDMELGGSKLVEAVEGLLSTDGF